MIAIRYGERNRIEWELSYLKLLRRAIDMLVREAAVAAAMGIGQTCDAASAANLIKYTLHYSKSDAWTCIERQAANSNNS